VSISLNPRIERFPRLTDVGCETQSCGGRRLSNLPDRNPAAVIIQAMSAQPQRKPEFAEPPIGVDWTLTFTRAETKKAHAYWNSLRGSRQMPLRTELSPRGMREFLTHVNLVDVGAVSERGASDYEVTLQGAHGLEVFGPLARRRFSAVLSEVTARRLRECLNLVRDSGQPVRINSRVTGGNKFWLDSECLIAPLGDDDGVKAIMWVFVSWQAADDH